MEFVTKVWFVHVQYILGYGEEGKKKVVRTDHTNFFFLAVSWDMRGGGGGGGGGGLNLVW